MGAAGRGGCARSSNAVTDESAPGKRLGSRLRERFAEIGLESELPELPGEAARPATFARRAARQVALWTGVQRVDVPDAGDRACHSQSVSTA